MMARLPTRQWQGLAWPTCGSLPSDTIAVLSVAALEQLAAAGAIGFLVSFGEVTVTAFVEAARTQTLPVLCRSTVLGAAEELL